jgi:hypothetical protein
MLPKSEEFQDWHSLKMAEAVTGRENALKEFKPALRLAGSSFSPWLVNDAIASSPLGWLAYR